jgi:hypothetical protein
VREDRRQTLPGSRVLKKILGYKREEEAGDWRRLRNEKLHNLYASRNIIRMIKGYEMGGTCSTYER